MSTMTTVMINAMDAFTVETLKKQGYSYEQLQQHVANNTLETIEVDVDTQQLLAFLQQAEVAQQAFLNNYQVKFLTRGGMRNLITLKFGIVIDEQSLVHNGLINLYINEEIEQQIRAFSSINWQFHRQADGTLSILAPAK